MANVAIVENNKVVYRGSLPKNWKHTSGLHNSKDDWEFLATLGIYPFEEVFPSYDKSTHVYDGWTEDIQADKVVLTWVVRAKTAEEISAAAALLAVSYKHDRAMEYPTLEECIHAILDDDLAALQVKRQAVKDKYPKP